MAPEQGHEATGYGLRATRLGALARLSASTRLGATTRLGASTRLGT